MEEIEASAEVRKEGNGYILYPRTNNDRVLLDNFISDKNGKYLSVSLKKRLTGKTYEQTKAFWALVTILFTIEYERKPSEDERNQFYRELLPVYFPQVPSLKNPGEYSPKSWSELSKKEASGVIEKMLEDLGDAADLPSNIELTCRDFFTWWIEYKGGLYKDPSDYGDDGKPLSLSEWAESNRLCMATGVLGGDVCHIISRQQGMGLEWLINQSWNLYRCRHDIHLNIQHGKGWEALFKMAPWLRGRYERAKRLFDEGKKLSLEGYTPEEITAHLAYSDQCKNDVPIKRFVETKENKIESSTKSLATEALQEEDFDIF